MPVTEVSGDGEFQSLMRRLAGEGRLVVVDFNAEWCGPCKAMKPVLVQMSERHPDVAFLSVNVDVCHATATSAQVSSIPAFHLFLRGEKVGELIGANPQGLQNLVEQHKKNARPTAAPGASFAGVGHRLGDAPSRPVVVQDETTRRVVDPAVLSELVAMGFGQEMAEKALLASNNDLVTAIDWITAHQEEQQPVVIGDAPMAMDTSEAATKTTKTLHNAVCNVCTKQIEGIRYKCKTCADWDECETCRKAPAGAHGGHDPTHEFTEHSEDIDAATAAAVGPRLSPEEIKAQRQRIKELVAAKRKKRELDEQAHQAQMEIDRRKSGAQLKEAKEKAREVQWKRADEERKRDARDAREALERVKKQIEQDKLERAAAKSGAKPAAPAPAPIPIVAMGPVTEVMVQVRLPDGTNMRKTFPPEARVRDVHSWVSRERTDAATAGRTGFALLMTMPRRVFSTPADLSLTLVDAGLAPSATLVVTIPPRS